MVHGPWPLPVGQNRAFDLFTDSAKILIRLKIRTEVVPQQGIELRPRAPFNLRKTIAFVSHHLNVISVDSIDSCRFVKVCVSEM